MTPRLEPWERQPKESEPAFEAFAAYRDLGTERSLTMVARRLAKSRPLISRWSARWHWVDRAAAWDRELDRRTLDQRTKDVRTMRERHAQLATSILTKVAQRLLGDPANNVAALDAGALTADQVARLAETAIRAEREAREHMPVLMGALGDQMELQAVEAALAGDTKVLETWLFNRLPGRWQDKRNAATAFASAAADARAAAAGPLAEPAKAELMDRFDAMTANLSALRDVDELAGEYVDTEATELPRAKGQ